MKVTSKESELMAHIAMRQESLDQLEREYKEACEEIAEECAAEGYPAHGSNYELRCESLYNNSYKEHIMDLRADLLSLNDQLRDAGKIAKRADEVVARVLGGKR